MASEPATAEERWKLAENEHWRWYERELQIQGQWKVTGITTPVHRVTGERVADTPGYLDESLVPDKSRSFDQVWQDGSPVEIRSELPPRPDSYGRISLQRRAEDGRPPSKWLRSMDTEELRDWLSQVEVSEAGVHGMTFWTHLTRDHLFKPLLIKGLTEAEQAKLHAAAHFGY